MLEHHIQKSIVYKLAFSEGLRFSELKPADLDNKLFNYHLKLVIGAGLVKKSEDGKYSLTADGRRVGIGVLDKQFQTLAKAHSVLFLIIRRQSDGAWLLAKRKTHPLFGRIGFIHANPVLDYDVFDTAQTDLKAKSGIKASFSYIGGGYFKVFEGSELESFTHFTALAAVDATGELSQNDTRAEYFWQPDINEISDKLLPTAKVLAEQYNTGKPFFVEQTFNL